MELSQLPQSDVAVVPPPGAALAAILESSDSIAPLPLPCPSPREGEDLPQRSRAALARSSATELRSRGTCSKVIEAKRRIRARSRSNRGFRLAAFTR